MPDMQTCFRYTPKNDSERNMLIALNEKQNSAIQKALYDPIILWLVDTKCVWVVPQNSFIYRLLLKQYPNQQEATFTQVKEVALSLMLGINDYY